MTVTSKIFLVEDDMLVASVMRQALCRNDKLEIILCSTAAECMNNLHMNPDIVVIDYNLPDQDGLSLMKNSAIFSNGG